MRDLQLSYPGARVMDWVFALLIRLTDWLKIQRRSST